MKKITVKTGKEYEVLIGSGILSDCGSAVAAIPGQKYKKAAIVTDDNVHKLYGAAVRDSLLAAGFAVEEFVFPHGEASKNMAIVQDIIGFLCEHYFTRSDLIVALGGGVVGDMAGFAASIYQRGIDYVQVPTTFLAAIDSSVGGKTAVNIPQGKNLVGSFWQPRLVLCNIDTLDTLDEATFGDGVAEALKYGCIWDESLFVLMENGGAREHLAEIIARCVQIKADVVTQDELDNGLRQILNFGHTMGHAVEKLSGFTLSHGKGVAVGMVIAADAGERAGITPVGTAARIRAALEWYSLPTGCEYTIQELCAQCLGDKKRSGNSLNLILLDRMGSSVIHPVQTDALEAFFVLEEKEAKRIIW